MLGIIKHPQKISSIAYFEGTLFKGISGVDFWKAKCPGFR
jgi:hypothetical protein